MLKNYNFVIYGANGWLGKALTDYCLKQLKLDPTQIILISGSVEELTLQEGVRHPCYKFEDVMKKRLENVIFFNFSFKLKDKLQELNTGNFLKENDQIKDKAEKLIRHLKPIKVIYSSSGAVTNPDPTLNPYGYQKLKDESFYEELCAALNIKLLIARIYNIAGPYMNKLDVYALGNFIKQAKQTGKIEISANNPVIRNYIHIYDLMNILCAWAEDPEEEDYINFSTGTEEEIELGELAKLVSEIMPGDISIVRDYHDTDLPNRYVSDIEAQNILTEKYGIKLKNMKDCVRDTYNYLKTEKLI